MKIVILSSILDRTNRDLILKTAEKVGAEICFSESEDNLPVEFQLPDVVYGFGLKIAKTNKNLKWLCVPSAGVDYLLKPGVFANEDCIVTNSSGAYGVTIAEHIIAVSLMMMRKLTEFYPGSLSGEWLMPRPQRSLKDSRITALGTGDIGCTFAQRARAFEPESLIGVCRSGKCKDPSFDRIYKTDKLDKVLPDTDLLVMSLPDTPETEGILSRERIALLPHDAYIVNVGRGSAIDEDALADALDSGKLAGAALDVFQTEPLPAESRLWKTKNLLITPHVAGNQTLAHTRNTNVAMFCEDLENYAAGRELKYRIDKKKGY